MATVGLVGGLGPESTIDYYCRILDVWARDEPSTAPSVVIDSLDVGRALRLVDTDRPALIEYLLASVHRLAGAGVDFVAMTANTPHIVFEELAARSSVPMLSIVEVCAHEGRSRGLRRLALLGTRFTMEGPFYPDVFARHGLAVVTPTGTERTWVHERNGAAASVADAGDRGRSGAGHDSPARGGDREAAAGALTRTDATRAADPPRAGSDQPKYSLSFDDVVA